MIDGGRKKLGMAKHKEKVEINRNIIIVGIHPCYFEFYIQVYSSEYNKQRKAGNHYDFRYDAGSPSSSGERFTVRRRDSRNEEAFDRFETVYKGS
jgi:hypothetical protein